MNIQKLLAVVTLATQSSLNPNLFTVSAQTSVIADELRNPTVLVGDMALPSAGASGTGPFVGACFANRKPIAASAEEINRLISTVARSVCGDGGPAASVLLNNPFRISRDQNGKLFMADSGVCFATDEFVMTGTIHSPVKTRTRSRKNFHHDFTVALHVFLFLKPSGMIVTNPDAAQPISLLNAGFARAPPRIGLPVLPRFDGALNHALFHRHAALPHFGICPRVSTSISAAILKMKHSSPVAPAREGMQT